MKNICKKKGENSFGKEGRRAKFAKFFGASTLSLGVLTAPLISGCGNGKTDVSAYELDGGATDQYDAGTKTDSDTGTKTDSGASQQCMYDSYVVLEVDGEKQKVKYGGTVIVGEEEFTIKRTENDGPLLENEKQTFVLGSSTDVNGHAVAFLGEGSEQTNAVVLQTEYYSDQARDFSSILSVGDTARLNVDDSHYVELTLNEVVQTGEVNYAKLAVKIFVESTDGSDTFISSKEVNAKLSLDGSFTITMDDDTALRVDLDLAGIGTSDGLAVLDINGEKAMLGKDSAPFDAGFGATVGVQQVFHSETSQKATVIITTPTSAIIRTLSQGEVIRIDMGEGEMLRVELTASELDCVQ